MVSKTYRNDGLEGRPTTIATGIDWIVDPANITSQGIQDYMSRFTPFNSLFIRNQDSNEIVVYPNGSPARKKVLPQGATMTVTNEAFSWIRINNAGAGTIAEGNITINIERLEVRK